ncbi:MAG: 4-alpha-glucanotransferase [Azospirillaceae bacterium]
MTALLRLAEAVGLDTGWHDIWGVWQEVSPETLRTILAALGLPAADEAEAAASLAALTRRRWGRSVDPVSVIGSEAQPGGIGVIGPEGGGPVAWTLDLEDGDRHEGTGEAAELTEIYRETVDGKPAVKRVLMLPADLPEGYHALTVSIAGRTDTARVIVAPPTCFGPEDAAPGERLWGLAAQLYALRGEPDQGIGHFPALGELVEQAGRIGADTVGINPLHALYPADPHQASPYSPASRDWLNVLYIDPTATPEWAHCGAAQDRAGDPGTSAAVERARAAELVDYPDVAGRLMPMLADLWATFKARELDTGSPRDRAFAAFREAGGAPLERFCRFMALQARFIPDDPTYADWRYWPEAWRDPDGPAVADWAAANHDAVDFQAWLQFVADEQLADVGHRAAAAGLRLGLYRDLAVGVSPGSAAAWAHPGELMRGVSVGAPPDAFNMVGQDWGLAPLDPLGLAESGYAPLTAALSANMRHAGALRIDHAMGLMRLFWIPEGMSPAQGTYLRLPVDDLFRVIALESRRHRCVVVGEDLGTVPEGFRPKMEAAGVLSYKVMMFERVGDGLFVRPGAYPGQALVTAGTHDLPTLRGFWIGRDIDWRRRLDLYPDAASRDADLEARETDKAKLLAALVDAGLWPADRADPAAVAFDDALSAAIHRFLAATPSRLMMVQLEDLIGAEEMMNLPGTVAEHPNWRRRLDRRTPALFEDGEIRALLDAVAATRAAPPSDLT